MKLKRGAMPAAEFAELEIATTSPGAGFYCLSFVGSAL